ncbi:PREDICTED: uncharacterized protein LOC106747527 [Dinoponera quadriceps]|uniref:Uncharacterized protein LOC106747527 n=1 Tax=Dinoponera quadriceps TaxID=609295 RepID=A0A6P3XQ26_DINQU|nr:PREDICTED: uncharacterized protein LOC106747527 [Dinoponera quadriceps]
MTRLVLGLLICVFVTASFVDTRLTKYAFHGDYNDYNDMQHNTEDESRKLNLFDLYRTYLEDNTDRGNRRDIEDDPENWTGRWMPDRLGDPTPSPKVYPHSEQATHKSMMENHHDMGHTSSDCDDAMTNLTVDWDHSVSTQTCYGHHIIPSKKRPRIYCEYIPKAYKAAHRCMNETIEYDDDVPLYGPHRPLWPVYGEYMYLPKQRWLHSLEHGAIVMLYHPCANRLEVKRLRELVGRCLWRHVITPCSDLDEDYPLALLSWGCKLTMSYVNPAVVMKFIRERALRGPEQTPEDGQFKDALLRPSEVVTDPTDSVLCPGIY